MVSLRTSCDDVARTQDKWTKKALKASKSQKNFFLSSNTPKKTSIISALTSKNGRMKKIKDLYYGK